MSDEPSVADVIAALDPEPAAEQLADLPLSRRQALALLASAGALGGVGSARAQQAAGGVIADEAVFSNYGSASTANGYDLTIDGETFSFAGAGEDIGLPDGSAGTEIVLPNGTTASEVLGPDGSTVFGSEIPDSVDNHATNWWPFSEGSGTTVSDGKGSTDISLNGPPWTSASRFNDGEAAGEFDQLDDYYVADSLGINGSQASIAGWVEITGNDDYARLFMAGDTTDPLTKPSNGWQVMFAGSTQLRITVANGGSTSKPVSLNDPPRNERIFVAATFDGDSASLYIYDSTQSLVDSGSG